MTKLELEQMLIPLVEIMDTIETDLILNILGRIDNYDGIKGSLAWYTEKLSELNLLNKNNLKIFEDNKEEIKKVITKLVNDCGKHVDNLDNLREYYNKGLLDVNPINLYNSYTINNLISEAVSETTDIMDLIQTKAIEGPSKSYKDVLNKAYLETSTGTYTYTESIRKAIDNFSQNGISLVNYKSGKTLSIEAVTRRDVITRMNKLNGTIELEQAKELGTNLVYVDQHLGARVRTKYTKHDYEAHAEWQGKKYMIDGSNDKYDNLYEKTGYGEMLGLKGINCYHNIRPTWEWEKVDERIDEVENAQKYYIFQKQRAYERRIRTLKRARKSLDIIKDKELLNKVNKEYKKTNIEYDYWLKQNKLTKDYNREYIANKKDKIDIHTTNYRDITKEILEKATPNSNIVKDRQYFEHDGVKYQVDNKNVLLDYSNKEKEVAEWLENTLGGEIYMMPRVNNPTGIQTADYLFRGEYWDLKEIVGNGNHTLDSAIKKKKSQSSNFIFDVSNSKITIDSINNQLSLIYKSKDRKWVNKVIIKRNNDVIVIYKRK